MARALSHPPDEAPREDEEFRVVLNWLDELERLVPVD